MAQETETPPNNLHTNHGLQDALNSFHYPLDLFFDKEKGLYRFVGAKAGFEASKDEHSDEWDDAYVKANSKLRAELKSCPQEEKQKKISQMMRDNRKEINQHMDYARRSALKRLELYRSQTPHPRKPTATELDGIKYPVVTEKHYDHIINMLKTQKWGCDEEGKRNLIDAYVYGCSLVGGATHMIPGATNTKNKRQLPPEQYQTIENTREALGNILTEDLKRGLDYAALSRIAGRNETPGIEKIGGVILRPQELQEKIIRKLKFHTSNPHLEETGGVGKQHLSELLEIARKGSMNRMKLRRMHDYANTLLAQEHKQKPKSPLRSKTVAGARRRR